jgi:hypothetical protein
MSMKSIFTLACILTALTANLAFGQIRKSSQTRIIESKRVTPQRPGSQKIVPQKDVETTKISNTEVVDTKKTDFEKFSDRLKIGYFGVLTLPNFRDAFNGDFNNAAISPEFGGSDSNTGNTEKKNQDTYPTNMWNQISFNYNFGAKMNFVFNPRWMTPLAHSVSMKKPEDRSLVALEDFLVGFQGVILTSEDKKFNLWIRPGMRLPTSRGSRSPHPAFGSLDRQLELAYIPTYDVNKTLQFGWQGQIRQWIYEDRYNDSRLRFSSSPFVQVTLNDTTRVTTYYNNIIENNKRNKSVNGLTPRYKDVWQGLMIGVSKDITPKFNIYPYIETFINDIPLSSRSAYFGAWISYQIK